MKKFILHRRPDTHAFTLVEMLAVITIIGIALAFIGMQSSPPRPINAARMASGMLELARAEALRSGTRARVGICMDSSSDTYLRQIVAVIDQDRNLTTDDWEVSNHKIIPSGTALMKTLSNASDTMSITLGSSSNTYAYIEFDPLGQCEISNQWVFARAVFDGAEPTFPEELNRDGFIVRQTGKIAFFDDPENIGTP